MSYHDLSECTLTADERRAEADRIVQMMNPGYADQCSQKEWQFVVKIADGGPVSVKQLFWLRDIKDKYL